MWAQWRERRKRERERDTWLKEKCVGRTKRKIEMFDAKVRLDILRFFSEKKRMRVAV